MPVPGQHYLVCTLKILAGRKIGFNLRRKSITGNLFKVISELDITRDLQHVFKRIHQLNHGAELYPLCGIIAMHWFVATIHSLGLSVVFPDIPEGFLHCIQVYRVWILLGINNRFFDTLGQVYTVKTLELFYT